MAWRVQQRGRGVLPQGGRRDGVCDSARRAHPVCRDERAELELRAALRAGDLADGVCDAVRPGGDDVREWGWEYDVQYSGFAGARGVWARQYGWHACVAHHRDRWKL